MFIELLPANKRLKQVIAEHGMKWVMDDDAIPTPMQCFNGEFGILISCPDCSHVRNVNISHVLIDANREWGHVVWSQSSVDKPVCG